MAFPVYTVDDLAQVTGRDAASFTNPAFVDQALLQATLLYRIGTNRVDMPGNDTDDQMVRYGILFMADAIILSQPYKEQMASPFSSESIGSYSYSKASNAVANGLPTGVSWFDMAVQLTSLGRDYDLLFGGIEILELDAEIGQGHIGENKLLISPRKRQGISQHPEKWVIKTAEDLEGWVHDPDHEGYLAYDYDEEP
jgi:hypothetical protein